MRGDDVAQGTRLIPRLVTQPDGRHPPLPREIREGEDGPNLRCTLIVHFAESVILPDIFDNLSKMPIKN